MVHLRKLSTQSHVSNSIQPRWSQDLGEDSGGGVAAEACRSLGVEPWTCGGFEWDLQTRHFLTLCFCKETLLVSYENSAMNNKHDETPVSLPEKPCCPWDPSHGIHEAHAFNVWIVEPCTWDCSSLLGIGYFCGCSAVCSDGQA